MGVDGLAAQGLVGHALACQGTAACNGAAGANAVGGFAGRAAQQFVGWQGGYFDVQVDAVHQGTAELGLVAVHLVRCTAAAVAGGALVATGAGIHGRDELKTRREFRPLRSPRDGDAAGFQRFAQGLQRGSWKLGQFV